MEQRETQELARTFTRFETWEQFLEEWQAVRSEGGAVGLLYAGARVPISATTVEGRTREVARRLDFYLKWACQEEWATQPNPAIATTSQQLVVKHWLKVLAGHAVDECFSDNHRRLLAFLNERWPSLLAPPYPRFIVEYLLAVHSTWRWGDLARKGVRLKIQDFTHLVVPALCVWGLGYVLAADGARPDAADHIERWLKSRSSEPSSAMRYISGYGEPITDFRQVDYADGEVNTRAALALFKLRHLAGKDVLAGSPTAPF